MSGLRVFKNMKLWKRLRKNAGAITVSLLVIGLPVNAYFNLNSGIEQNAKDIIELKSEFKHLKADLSRVENKVDKVEVKIDKVEDKVDKIENKIDKMYDLLLELKRSEN